MSSSDKKSLLSVKMEHSIMRNQMKRIIENLLYFSNLDDAVWVSSPVPIYTINTKTFKENFRSRYFSYLFNEYQKLLKEDKEGFASRIFLKTEDKALRNL